MAAKAKREARAPKSIQNRRARYDYAIEDEVEAGIVLVGSEVKSIFDGKVSLNDAYCRVLRDELWLLNADIEPYAQASLDRPDRRRDRKLLMHKHEIVTLERKSLEKGMSLIPLEMYFKNGKVKLKIGLGKGKAEYDKRKQITKNETRREIERARSEKY